MTERKLVPHIRFKGFEEEWKDFVLGRLAKFLNGRAYKQSELLNSGKYPVLRVGNFYTNASWYYSNLQLPEKYYAEKGDLLYTWSATFGPHIWNGSKVIYHYHIWKLELSPLLNKEFTFQLLLEDRSKLLNNTNGSTMIHLTKSEMESKIIRIPNSEEQQKIGNLFAKLDRLLDLQQQKLDQLELLKKALLQKLFPKQGVKIPELRFKGFEDEWRKNKANKIFKSISDKHHADLAVLAASQAEGMILRDSIGIDIKYEKSSLDSYKRVMPGQFVIHLRSFQGGFAYSRYEGIISPAYTVLSFIKKEEQDSIFWKYVFLSGNFIRRLKTITYGVRDGKSISYSDFGFLFMYYPSVPEQQKIGNLLIKVDHLIEVENKKLNNLKQVKKSLLQNMFVE